VRKKERERKREREREREREKKFMKTALYWRFFKFTTRSIISAGAMCIDEYFTFHTSVSPCQVFVVLCYTRKIEIIKSVASITRPVDR